MTQGLLGMVMLIGLQVACLDSSTPKKVAPTLAPIPSDFQLSDSADPCSLPCFDGTLT